MRKKQLKIGQFVKYALKTPLEPNSYGLVYRIHFSGSPSDGQVVWFEKDPCFSKYRKKVEDYHISGFLYNNLRQDCVIAYKIPKKILNKVGEALQFVLKREASYGMNVFTNLDYIELLARVKKLL